MRLFAVILFAVASAQAATYFVSPYGTNSNTGLSAAPINAWQTITFALTNRVGGGVTNGDTVWIAPGTYRERTTVGITPLAMVFINGDPKNSQGFTDLNSIKIPPGVVNWTCYTNSDRVAGPNVALLTLNGSDYLSFSDLVLIPSTQNNVLAAATSTNISFTRCIFLPVNASVAPLSITVGFGVVANWTFDQCAFLNLQRGALSTLTFLMVSGTGSDWDANLIVRNSLFVGGNDGASHLLLTKSGASANVGGGFHATNNTFFGSIAYSGAATPTNLALASTLVNNVILSSGTGISAGDVNQVYEDWNLILAATARANVTAGANSITDWSPNFNAGAERLFGLPPSPFSSAFWGQLQSGSSWTGYGTNYGSTMDLLSRLRPAGGTIYGSATNSLGAYERHDTAVFTNTVGYNALTGPSDLEFPVAVDAVPTLLSVRGMTDGSHGTNIQPQFIMLANPYIGVSAQTNGMTVDTNTWQTLSTTIFTPTARGYVTCRLQTATTNVNGVATFDSWALQSRTRQFGFGSAR